MGIKTKINKWDLIKIKSFFTMKDSVSKVIRQPSDWEKIITNKAMDKELISKTHNQLICIIYKKIYNSIPQKQTTQSKNGEKI